MNRSTFLRRFAGGLVAIVAAPTLLEAKPQPIDGTLTSNGVLRADLLTNAEHDVASIRWQHIHRAAEKIADVYRQAHIRRGGLDVVAHPTVTIVHGHAIYVRFRADEMPICTNIRVSTKPPIGQHRNVVVRQLKYQMLKSIEEFYRMVG